MQAVLFPILDVIKNKKTFLVMHFCKKNNTLKLFKYVGIKLANNYVTANRFLKLLLIL